MLHSMGSWVVIGEADYVLRVVVADLRTFSNFLMHTIPVIAKVRSTILLERVSKTTALPIS